MTATWGFEHVTHVGLDADDTLWHSEDRFVAAHERFRDLLAEHVELTDTQLEATMLARERANLRLFGYGAKGFTLSLIETAIEVTEGRIPADDIGRIIAFGKDLLDHPVDLLDGVEATIEGIRERGLHLTVITKGDLWHQESKLAASGLAERFDAVEIVSEKDERTYRGVLSRLGIEAGRFAMVGNSVPSDVLPVLAIGGHAAHLPYRYTWAHEVADAHDDATYPTLTVLTDLLALLDGTAR